MADPRGPQTDRWRIRCQGRTVARLTCPAVLVHELARLDSDLGLARENRALQVSNHLRDAQFRPVLRQRGSTLGTLNATDSIIFGVDTMHIGMGRRPMLWRGAIHAGSTGCCARMLVAAVVNRVSADFSSQICDRVLQAVELATQHIELASTESHETGSSHVLLKLQHRITLVNILTLVWRMV